MSDIIFGDCMVEMKKIPNNFANLTLTDIPYEEVNRKDNGLRNLNKENADIRTFELDDFIKEIDRITSGTIVIFCGNEQYSKIYSYFSGKQRNGLGTVRQIIWGKSNPSPMNGKYIYLSATENAVWFRKKGATFNAHCKKNFFIHSTGRSKLHPTEKNHELLRELILDNSNSGDLVFDPCMGSGSHLLVSMEEGRRITGIELDEEYFKIAEERLSQLKSESISPPKPEGMGIRNGRII